MAFAMGWEILWPLILGFALSAVVQAVVSHREMARLLPDDRPRSIATARRGARPRAAAVSYRYFEFVLSRQQRTTRIYPTTTLLLSAATDT